jgi:hypothetical protein
MRSLDLFRERLMERYLSMISHSEQVLDPPPALPPSKPGPKKGPSKPKAEQMAA